MLNSYTRTNTLPLAWRVFVFSCILGLFPQAIASAVEMGISVVEIATGRHIEPDKTVKEKIDEFGVRDTLYVSVQTTGSGTATLGTEWSYGDQLILQRAQEIETTGDAVHEFHLAKATPWPKGAYRVVVTLDGDSVGVRDFRVR